jgi:hypothetical protein
MVVSTRGSVKSIIDHIIDICGFPDDSIMTEYIREQGWRELSDVVMITLDEVADFKLVTDDGSYKAKPLNHHLRKFCQAITHIAFA